MADLSKIKIDDVDYNIKDAYAREQLENVSTTIPDGSITEQKLSTALATTINTKANTNALASEISNRQSADNELTGRITQEANARQDADEVLSNRIDAEIATRQTADDDLSDRITALQGAVGSPLMASTVAGMTDTTKIYVYTGSETNYTAGDWYYYNGSAWVSGGVYNAVAVDTDETLSVSGMPADAEAVGDKFDEYVDSWDDGYLKEEISGLSWTTGYVNKDTAVIETTTRGTKYTTNILQYDHSVIFACDDFSAYEISIVVYNQSADTHFYGKGFVSQPIPIPKGYRFRAQIRKKVGTSEADVYKHAQICKVHTTLTQLFVHGISNDTGIIAADENARNWALLEPLKLEEDSIIGLRDYETYKYTLQVFDSYSPYATPSASYYSKRKDIEVAAGKSIRVIVNRIDLDPSITRKDAEEQFDIEAKNVVKVSAFNDFKNLVSEQIEGTSYNIAEVRNRLIALESDNAIPSYYEEHIADKVDDINDLRDDLTTGTQFAFITDVHVNAYNQTFHSKALLHYICQNTLVKDVFNGGDIANGKVNPHLGKVAFLKQVRRGIEYCNADSYVNTFFVVGNHDLGVDYADNVTEGAIITAQELYDVSGIKDNVLDISQDANTPFNYTYTDDTHQIYYVVCSADLRDTVTGEYYKYMYIWFCNALKACPDDYTIIVFNHIVLHNSSDKKLKPFLADMFGAINAYNSRGSSPQYSDTPATVIDFSECGGEVCCLIGGHSHIDFSKNAGDTIAVNDANNTQVTLPVPLILTTTDNCGAESTATGHLTRTVGTTTEQAFDVFTIDTTNRTIKTTRIGAGSDRTFSY